MPLLIAHRGASADEPENSLAAFRRAIAVRADGIELDVHATADHALVVHHDGEIDGQPIRDRPLAVVREFRLANGEPIPTLAEALATITPHADVFVELKHMPASLDGHLLELFDTTTRPDRCHVHAFDHRIIRRLTKRRPALSAGILSGSYVLNPVEQIEQAGAAALWQHADLVDASLATLVHGIGAQLYAWTVDRPEHMRRLVADGVDGICTNRPDVAWEVFH